MTCGTVGAGCVTVNATRPPPCPMPSETALEQTRVLDGTEAGWWLGELKRYCDGIRDLRRQ